MVSLTLLVLLATADPPAAGKAEPTAARKVLDRLKALKSQDGGQALTEEAAGVLRDFIQLGPDAVPELIAELDATTDGYMLRCLGVRRPGDRR